MERLTRCPVVLHKNQRQEVYQFLDFNQVCLKIALLSRTERAFIKALGHTAWKNQNELYVYPPKGTSLKPIPLSMFDLSF
jgi:hypothetical protein